jgi:hypothetical protein
MVSLLCYKLWFSQAGCFLSAPNICIMKWLDGWLHYTPVQMTLSRVLLCVCRLVQVLICTLVLNTHDCSVSTHHFCFVRKGIGPEEPKSTREWLRAAIVRRLPELAPVAYDVVVLFSGLQHDSDENMIGFGNYVLASIYKEVSKEVLPNVLGENLYLDALLSYASSLPFPWR